ncbi:MAG TPA: condensation domain-containing protein, partial [Longimicrobium sp.]|nr:condensation domain-containing protein [Longimicrobium sp.]
GLARDGRPWGAALFRAPGAPLRLLLLLHPLAFDAPSAQALVDGLAAALAGGGERDEAPSYRSALHALADGEAPAAEAVDGLRDAALAEDDLSAEETRALLSDLPLAYRCGAADALLAAAALAGDAASAPVAAVDGARGLPRGDGAPLPLGAVERRASLHLPASPPAGPRDALRGGKEALRAALGLPGARPPAEWVRDRSGDAPALALRWWGRAEVEPPAESGLRVLADRGPGWTRGTPEPGAARTLDARVAGGRLRLRALLRDGDDAAAGAWLDRIAAALREILAHVAAGGRGCTPSDFPLSGLDAAAVDRLFPNPAEVEDTYPLTPLQREWLDEVLRGEKQGVYCLYQRAAIPGPGFDPAAFRAAWQAVTDAQAALRTSFAWEGLAEPLQVVHRRVPVRMDEADLRGLPADEQEARIAAYVEGARAEGFAPDRAPHARHALFRLDDERYEYAWIFSHLLQDGWTAPILLRGVLDAYDAACQGRAPAVEPTTPFREHVAWIRRHGVPGAEEYWRHALAGLTRPTPLGPRPVPWPFRSVPSDYRKVERTLSLSVSAGIRAAARRHQVTANTLFQAAWALLLAERSGETDVAFGMMMSGRPADMPGVESVAGLCLSLLPLRARVAWDAPLVPWLRELQGRITELRQYEHTPREVVRAACAVPEPRPLCDSYVVFENFPFDQAVEKRLGRLMRPGDSLPQTEHPLRIVCFPWPRFYCYLSYYRQCFDDAEMARLLADFEGVLRAFGEAAPEQALRGVLRSAREGAP